MHRTFLESHDVTSFDIPTCHFLFVVLWNGVSLPLAVFEILPSKHIGVTSLTVQGHATSSVTWPFHTPYAIFYWWAIENKPLSLTVSEIFKVKCNAMVDMTLIDTTSRQRSSHSFWYQSIIRLPMLSIVTFALGRTV